MKNLLRAVVACALLTGMISEAAYFSSNNGKGCCKKSCQKECARSCEKPCRKKKCCKKNCRKKSCCGNTKYQD